MAWKQLGYMYHYAGLTDLAEAAFRRVRDLDPSPPQPYWMHGRMLLYQGRTHEAEQEVRRALERYPDQFKLLTFLNPTSTEILRQSMLMRKTVDYGLEQTARVTGDARSHRKRNCQSLVCELFGTSNALWPSLSVQEAISA